MDKRTLLPKGLQVAKVRAKADFERGRGITHCPYAGKAWRTVWLRELERLQQMRLFE